MVLCKSCKHHEDISSILWSPHEIHVCNHPKLVHRFACPIKGNIWKPTSCYNNNHNNKCSKYEPNMIERFLCWIKREKQKVNNLEQTERYGK